MPGLSLSAPPVVRRALLDGSLWLAILAFFILAGLIAATFAFAAGQRQDTAIVSQTLEVQKKLSRVLSLMADAETGQRGFLLTGNPTYLIPYTRSADALPPAL